MKKITHEWLEHAWQDLEAARQLVTIEHLTGIAAFHAQQTVEKALKAIIEEYDLGLVKTHDIERLYATIEGRIILEEDMLEQLNTVYLDARYPADFGLMPGGLPSKNEAENLLNFAEKSYETIKQYLKKKPNR